MYLSLVICISPTEAQLIRKLRVILAHLPTRHYCPRSGENSATCVLQVFLSIFMEILLSSHIKTHLSVRYVLGIHSNLIISRFKHGLSDIP